MLTKNQIIEQLFRGKNFRDCISKMEPEHLREDLRQEVALIVCEWPEERIIGLHDRGELEFYVVRVILNQIASSTSPFHKKFRMLFVEFDTGKWELREEYNLSEAETGGIYADTPIGDHNYNRKMKAIVRISDSEKAHFEERLKQEELDFFRLAQVNNELGKLHWYDAELIQLYLKHGSYRALERETGIPYSSIFKSIQKSLKLLRQKTAEVVPIFSHKEQRFIQNGTK